MCIPKYGEVGKVCMMRGMNRTQVFVPEYAYGLVESKGLSFPLQSLLIARQVGARIYVASSKSDETHSRITIPAVPHGSSQRRIEWESLAVVVLKAEDVRIEDNVYALTPGDDQECVEQRVLWMEVRPSPLVPPHGTLEEFGLVHHNIEVDLDAAFSPGEENVCADVVALSRADGDVPTCGVRIRDETPVPAAMVEHVESCPHKHVAPCLGVLRIMLIGGARSV